MAEEAGHAGARGRRASPTTTSSRPTSATATATPPAASAPSTSSASPASRSFNVNNNCSTGSTALLLAQAGRRGRHRRLRARARLREDGEGRARRQVHGPHQPARQARRRDDELRGFEQAPAAAQMFGNAGREHMEKYGTKPEHFAKIGGKNHKHSVNNPYAQFQDEYTLEEILARRGLRSADPAPVLPDLGRRRPRRSSRARVRRRARPRGTSRRDRRPGDDDRLRRPRSTRRAASRWSATTWRSRRRAQVYEQAGSAPRTST